MTNWINDIAKLAEFALSQPQACYAAYTFGLKHRWTYFLRTLPDIHARGFWERHRSAFFDVMVCHPNAVSYRDLEAQQIYRIHENEKKRLYSRRVLDIEYGTFTPLVFPTTGGMGKECLMYHSRLAQLIAIKKGEQYAKTISWIRTRTSFALLRSALVCLRGARTRGVPCNIKNVDIDVEVVEGAVQLDY